MSFQAKLMITALLLANAVLVVELLRTRRLTESYTLLWLFVIAGTTCAAWADGFLQRLAWFFGAATPLSALTLLGLAFILVMLIFFSMRISRLTKELKDLAQEVALRLPSSGKTPKTEDR
ncbi:MAG: DUF2304 domain-containing protein [Deltaproteobacteria bacterium]|nr:DUF2304 domain-containing protein [Deltaproteobacteria bacterium]